MVGGIAGSAFCLVFALSTVALATPGSTFALGSRGRICSVASRDAMAIAPTSISAEINPRLIIVLIVVVVIVVLVVVQGRIFSLIDISKGQCLFVSSFRHDVSLSTVIGLCGRGFLAVTIQKNEEILSTCHRNANSKPLSRAPRSEEPLPIDGGPLILFFSLSISTVATAELEAYDSHLKMRD
jgi:hypothetical protein